MINQPNQNYDNFIDIQIQGESGLPQMDDTLERGIIKLAQDVQNKHAEALKDCNGLNLSEKMEEVERADRLEHCAAIKNKPKYRSKIFLGWTNQAHLSTVVFMYAMMMSGQWKSLTGNTPEDKKNAEYMSKVINYKFDTDYHFRKVLIQTLVQFVKRGMTCCKGFWQVIKSYVYNYDPIEDAAGNITGFQAKKGIVNRFNDVQLEYVDIKKFSFYPIDGRFSDAIKVQECKEKKYTELKHNYEQFPNRYVPGSIDKLQQGNSGTKNNLEEKGIKITEVWIPLAYIEGKELANVVCVIANNKTVIEYKPYPYDYGIEPYMYSVFETIEGSLFGKGLCFSSTTIQSAANTYINLIFDILKVAANPMSIVPQSMADVPIVSRPAGKIPWPDELLKLGLGPKPFMQDASKIPALMQSLQLLKSEFEASTVPDFIRGVRPQKDETATRDVLVQQGGENKLNNAADNFNEEILKMLIQLIYILYKQRSEIDPEVKIKMAKICLDHTKMVTMPKFDDLTMEPEINPETGMPVMEEVQVEKSDEELLDEFGKILPLERVDVKVSGYNTNIKKQQKLQNYKVFMDMLKNFADEGDLRHINHKNIIDEIMLMLDIDPADAWYSEDEAVNNAMKNIVESLQLEVFKVITQQKIMMENGIPPQVPPNNNTQPEGAVNVQQ